MATLLANVSIERLKSLDILSFNRAELGVAVVVIGGWCARLRVDTLCCRWSRRRSRCACTPIHPLL